MIQGSGGFPNAGSQIGCHLLLLEPVCLGETSGTVIGLLFEVWYEVQAGYTRSI